MVSVDFFTKRVLTLRGVRDTYVLVFIHLDSRKVYSSSATYHPNSEWIVQQARNAAMWIEDEGIELKFLIRDRDKKDPKEVDTFWRDGKVRLIKIPSRAPMANSYVETYIGPFKREVLNHFVCYSLEQLDYIIRIWLCHYHEQRPHRGVERNNTVLDVDFVPQSKGQVRCRTQLGGLIREYYREAA